MGSKPKVKICGITTEQEIRFINRMAVDYIGFVFAKSKRRVTVDQVKELRKYLRTDIQVVGVFVNETPRKINEIVDVCRLDIVQLHGQEIVDEMKQIKVPIWNAVGVKTKKDIRLAENSIAKEVSRLDAVLLDYRDAGSGQSFDWSLIPKKRQYRLVLAGGINMDNVREAMERVEPDVIDVSSGVEENGKKSEELVSQFIRRIKGNE